MTYKVLIGFSGAVSASANSFIELTNEELIKDLENAGYIIPVEGKDDKDKTVKDGEGKDDKDKTETDSNEDEVTEKKSTKKAAKTTKKSEE